MKAESTTYTKTIKLILQKRIKGRSCAFRNKTPTVLTEHIETHFINFGAHW